jgi:selenocysteine-specific elongation factor
MKALDAPVDGRPELAQLWLSRPVLAFPGDRFILRRPSPANTIAGGVVIETFSPLRLKRSKALERLTCLRNATLEGRLQLLVNESKHGLLLRDLVTATGIPVPDLAAAVKNSPNFFLHAGSQRVISHAWLKDRRTKLIAWLSKFHQQNPSKGGASIASARLGLTAELAAIVFESFPTIRIVGDSVSLVAHRASFNDREQAALAKIEGAFRSGGFTPPALSEVLKLAAPEQAESQMRSLLEILIKSNRLVRISADLVFHADVIAHIRNSLATHKGRRFSVPEFKEWMQISRKFAIPLLEYLDHAHVTKRDGDNRIVL